MQTMFKFTVQDKSHTLRQHSGNGGQREREEKREGKRDVLDADKSIRLRTLV